MQLLKRSLLSPDLPRVARASIPRTSSGSTLQAVIHEHDAALRRFVRVRQGRNLTDKAPPIASASFGYISDVHSNRGRYIYIDYSISF